MFKLKLYIRILFSSLMLLPLIILAYFIMHFSENPYSISLYFKNKPATTVKGIAWPDNGLLTLWFDSAFFAKNKKTIVALMNKYQFSGVISFSQGSHARSLSKYQLIMLQNQGWEITQTNTLRDVMGEHEINDMPAPDPRGQVVYDMSSGGGNIRLINFLKETKVRNGWIILYFHTIVGSKVAKPLSSAKLNHILQMVKHSGIPVVLQEQVLKVSQ